MDETGLNFRLLPRQTYMHKTEKSKYSCSPTNGSRHHPSSKN